MKNYNGKYIDLYHMHDILETINEEDNKSISQATKFPRIFLFEKKKVIFFHYLPQKSEEVSPYTQ